MQTDNATETKSPASAGLAGLDILSYVKLAKVTDSPDTAPEGQASYARAYERLISSSPGLHDRVYLLICKLIKIRQAGSDCDSVKRLLFYGSEWRDPKELPEWTYTPELRDAIRQRLQNPDHLRVIHAILGIASEAAELAEGAFDVFILGKEMDLVNLLKEEPGDVVWYLALLFDIFHRLTGRNPVEILAHNIDKLEARYGAKFDEFRAKNRDLAAERKILEQKWKGNWEERGVAPLRQMTAAKAEAARPGALKTDANDAREIQQWREHRAAHLSANYSTDYLAQRLVAMEEEVLRLKGDISYQVQPVSKHLDLSGAVLSGTEVAAAVMKQIEGEQVWQTVKAAEVGPLPEGLQ